MPAIEGLVTGLGNGLGNGFGAYRDPEEAPPDTQVLSLMSVPELPLSPTQLQNEMIEQPDT